MHPKIHKSVNRPDGSNEPPTDQMRGIAALLRYTDFTYVKIGAIFDASASFVHHVAKRYHLDRHKLERRRIKAKRSEIEAVITTSDESYESIAKRFGTYPAKIREIEKEGNLSRPPKPAKLKASTPFEPSAKPHKSAPRKRCNENLSRVYCRGCGVQLPHDCINICRGCAGESTPAQSPEVDLDLLLKEQAIVDDILNTKDNYATIAKRYGVGQSDVHTIIKKRNVGRRRLINGILD